MYIIYVKGLVYYILNDDMSRIFTFLVHNSFDFNSLVCALCSFCVDIKYVRRVLRVILGVIMIS